MALLTATNIIGLIMTGILSLFWYDLRTGRNEMKEIKEEFKNLLKIEYVNKKDCDNQRKIDILEAEKFFRKVLDENSEKILHAIERNGK